MLSGLVADCVYTTLNQDLPPVKISSPIVGASLWTMAPPKNLVLMGDHNLHPHRFKTFWRHGESNIDSHQWTTYNSMAELRLQLKLPNVSSGKTHLTMDPSISNWVKLYFWHKKLEQYIFQLQNKNINKKNYSNNNRNDIKYSRMSEAKSKCLT